MPEPAGAIGAAVAAGRPDPHGHVVPFTVFLDRDGVFNPDPHQEGRFPYHIRSPAAYELYPGAADAFARLNRPDVQTCLTTNQPFAFTMPIGVRRVHRHLRRELAATGGRLDRVEIARMPFPHRRRKPRPGMLRDAAAAFALEAGFDRTRAVMIGDKVRDGEAARRFGVASILLRTSSDVARVEAWAAKQPAGAAVVVDDLAAAVAVVLERL